MITKEQFEHPSRAYAVRPMTHGWGKDPEARMDAYLDYGYAGAVTNVPFGPGFTSDPENIKAFGRLIGQMEKKGLSYWIYDENGYPSGQGGGLTLKGHPEYRAKGFYMRRRIAYEPKHCEFSLDDESDKIVWAAKYPVVTPRIDESFVQFDRMTPVPFTAEHVSCDLAEKEILYVFCVKDAHEGSHSTHNVSSFKHNINVMNKDAVRRFIDCCFEPVAAMLPDAYRNAENVFTDEPSLHAAYSRSYEVWPYALAPWTDGLFDAYEAEYGESLLPVLPLLFEGGENAYPVRVRFYELVGKLIADAYSGQISAWCEAHGCGFSGHYLIEENMVHHVKQYGNYVRVVSNASYPGIDVLTCSPSNYNYNTTKFAQMAVRKKHTNGMMVEICPFVGVDEFQKDPLGHMTAVMGLLYLGGVRVTNSYFGADFSGWKNGKLGTSGGYTDEEQTRYFNRYVSRLGLMLDHRENDCGTFVYYAIEDVQAKTQPLCTAGANGPENAAEYAERRLTDAIYSGGHDFFYADRDDLCEAAKTLAETGCAMISGHRVTSIAVPAMDVMYRASAEALKALASAGIPVRFMDGAPRFAAEDGAALDTEGFAVCSGAEIAALADAADPVPYECAEKVAHGAFADGSGGAVYMFANYDTEDRVILPKEDFPAELWNVSDGSVKVLAQGEAITVPAMRAVFVVKK